MSASSADALEQPALALVLAGRGLDGNAAPLAGEAVVVTGSMTGPLGALSRNEMNELIERAGGNALHR